MTNLEWLYHESGLFSSSMRFWAVYFGHAEDDVEADAWLMADNDENALDSDISAADVDANDGNAAQDMDMSASVQKCSNELSEGDVLHELRYYADDVRYDYNPLDDAFEPDERLSELCGQVADMIERDYVPQANYRNMCKHIGEAHRERNELKDRIVELEKQWDARDSDCIALEAKVNRLEDEITDWSELHAQVMSERNHVIAERDEWKTKCETREFAYKQADAERKRYSEQVDELQAERDELAELQAAYDELTAQLRASNAERERLRECLGIATDNAHDLLTLVDESGNVYDRDEGLA